MKLIFIFIYCNHFLRNEMIISPVLKLQEGKLIMTYIIYKLQIHIATIKYSVKYFGMIFVYRLFIQ